MATTVDECGMGGVMPTESEYREAAEYFEGAAKNAFQQIAKIDLDWDDLVAGGYLPGLIDRTVSASVSNIRSISSGLDALKSECDRRAGVCHAYDEEIRQFNRDKAEYNRKVASKDPNPGREPTLSDPPEPWVTPSVGVRY